MFWRRLSLLSIGSFSKFLTVYTRFYSFNLNLWSIISDSSIPHNLVTLLRIVESSCFPTVSATVLTSYQNLVSLALTALFKNIDSCFLLILDYWAEIQFLNLYLCLTVIPSALAVLSFSLISKIFSSALTKQRSSRSLFLPRRFLPSWSSPLICESSSNSMSVT